MVNLRGQFAVIMLTELPESRLPEIMNLLPDRAAEFGLVDVLDPDHASDPHRMAKALQELPYRKRPSECGYKIDLDGLQRIGKIVGRIIRRRDRGLRGDRPNRRVRQIA